ncbi:hypothetical protein PS3A_13590 [Pseudomonas sp. 3A(2025)]
MANAFNPDDSTTFYDYFTSVSKSLTPVIDPSILFQRYALGDAVSYARTAEQNLVLLQVLGGNELIVGGAGNDMLEGGAGNDTLDGGAGADTMIGGDGSDSYYVREDGDVVIETNATQSIGGSDLVYSYLADYTLTANVENGRIMSTTAANLTGNDLNNVLFAGQGNNVLNGGAGIDTVSYAFGVTGPTGVSVSLATESMQATGGSGRDTLISIEHLIGSAYADYLIGNKANNSLNGGAGNDTLDGGTGADTMMGGDGDDSYYVRESGDVVIETSATQSTGGTDIVHSYLANYTLGANIENGRIASLEAANLTGNSLDNLLYAGEGDNVLNGGAGIDTVTYGYGATTGSAGVSVSLAVTTAQATGGSGSDTLISIEHLIGSAFADQLTGNSANNRLEGGAGNDTLDGGAGADTMIGGGGNDIYHVRDSNDTVIETDKTPSSGGLDTVYSYLSNYTLGANVENGRIMSAAAANLTGNELKNVFYAGQGNNVLNGGAGTDTVSYFFGTTGTTGVSVSLAVTTAQATGGSGSDTLISIENLIGSSFADKLTGNSENNNLTGGAGNDTLDGGAGWDTMVGGDGSDSYYVRDIKDTVIETNATQSIGGSDLVYSYLSAYTLTANVENGRIMSTTAVNLTGNELNNVLFAGQGNNVLNGGAGIDTVSYAFGTTGTTGVSVSLAATAAQATGGSGSDTLISIENLIGSAYADTLTGNSTANSLTGGAGNDTLNGGAGNDVLVGGVGADKLYGGSGADRFDFNALNEMGVGATLRDVIGDFKHSEGDKIDLSTLDADLSTSGNDAFTFIGSNAFSSNATAQLRFADGILYGSVNADANAEFEIQLLGVSSLQLSDLIV